jgi:MFS family permease
MMAFGLMNADPRRSLPPLSPQRFPFRIWLITFFGWTFDFYDLLLFSFVLVPIGRELGLTQTEEALLLGSALGASGIGGILFGWLSDRLGRKRVMTWTIGLYSLGTGLTALAMDPVSLLVFRLVTGLGVGGEWAVGHAILAESTPVRLRGRAAAFLQAGEPVGVGLAALSGLLLTPLVGWRLVFLLSSASAAIALVARRYLPESSLWDLQHAPSLSFGAALRRLVHQHLVVPMLKGWLLGVFKMGTYWTCYIWLPKFLQNELGQEVAQTAGWMLTAQLGQFLGMLAFGVVSDCIGRRWAFSVYSVLTAAAVFPLALHWEWLIQHPGIFWTDLFLLGVGSGCTAGFGALLAELFPTQVRNFAMGTCYNCARSVQFFAPLVVSAFVADYGLTGGMSVPLVLALATAAWVWTLPETRTRNLARIET